DPGFAAPAGPDGVLGFSRDATGDARIVDDGDPGFARAGSWVSVASGRGGGALEVESDFGTASSTAAWTVPAHPGPWYRLAVTWPSGSGGFGNALYTVRDGSTPIASLRLSQAAAPSGFTLDGTAWQSLGLFSSESGTLSVELSNYYTYGTVLADAML